MSRMSVMSGGPRPKKSNKSKKYTEHKQMSWLSHRWFRNTQRPPKHSSCRGRPTWQLQRQQQQQQLRAARL
eukprot:12532866-Heterocapsa_arctica.AAC.1